MAVFDGIMSIAIVFKTVIYMMSNYKLLLIKLHTAHEGINGKRSNSRIL